MKLLIIVLTLTIFVQGAKEKIGGEIVFDKTNITGDDCSTHGREIRRARLYLKGKNSSKFVYEIEYSFTGKNEWKDVYIKYNPLNNLGIEVGNIKEPIGLENLTSSKNSTFMEHSLIDTFMQSRKLGILIEGNYVKGEDKGTISLGIFGKSLDKLLKKKRDGTSIIGRLTYALIKAKDDIIHLGLSTGTTKYNHKSIKFSTNAGTHIYNGSLIKNKIKNTNKIKRFSSEVAIVKGSFSFQGEYMATTASDNRNNYSFNGWYGEVSWFATGEHKKYKIKSAKFSRIKIKKPFKKGINGYWGALEIASRISKIDLSNKDKTGGEETDLTLGINYYPQKNIKLMANYTFSEVNKPKAIKEKVIAVRGIYIF